jgi:hypothetical protein
VYAAATKVLILCENPLFWCNTLSDRCRQLAEKPEKSAFSRCDSQACMQGIARNRQEMPENVGFQRS